MKSITIFIVLLFFFLKPSYAQINLKSGLVAFYPFNGNANDESGNNNHCEPVNNPVLTTDRYNVPNAAYSFNGKGSHFRIKDKGDFSSPRFSIVLWFYTQSKELQSLVGKRDFAKSAGTGGSQYQMFINYAPYPGVGSNVVGNNSTCNSITSSSYINTRDQICNASWYCVIVTYDGKRHKLYLNGELKRDEKTADFNSLLQCDKEVRIGNWWKLDMQNFNGKIDDIRWYNRALNNDEIAKLSTADFEESALKIKGNTTFCEGDSVVLEAPKANNTDYNWYHNNTAVEKEKSNFLVVKKPGAYQLKTNSKGCRQNSKIVPVTVNKYPSREVTVSSTLIKKGDTIILKAIEDNAAYVWNDKSTQQQLLVQAPGDYFVKIDNKGCAVQSDTITIKQKADILPVPFTKRNNELIKIIEVTDTALIVLNFHDYRQEDGDIISVYVNDVEILKEQLLSKNPLQVSVKLSSKTPVAEVKIVAENLGRIPPNTAMMETVINGKKQVVQIVSSGQKNAIIRIKLK